jgi:hypothetical protein
MSVGFRKLGFASLILLLVLIIPSSYGADNENPWEFLKDFKHVRGAITPVEERYMAALFHNAQRKLNALVLFPAQCVSGRCSLGEPIAFSVFDSRGLLVRFHAEPNERSVLQKIITSGSGLFTAA